MHKSKKKFLYQFNEKGYAVAISLDKNKINKKTLTLLERLLKKNHLKLNLSKTDQKFINNIKKNNNLFLSLYKKMLLNNHGLSR